MVWVEAGRVDLQPLDRVEVHIDGRESQGQVMVVPEALLRPVPVSGRIVRLVEGENRDEESSNLPGADMPPLGRQMEGGTVLAVDAENRTFTLEMSDGSRLIQRLRGNS